MPYITILGAGSTMFARQLITDILLIDNLPDGCVEVACLVDQNGVQPCHFGSLPEQLAGLNRAHMTVHALMRDALLHREKENDPALAGEVHKLALLSIDNSSFACYTVNNSIVEHSTV